MSGEVRTMDEKEMRDPGETESRKKISWGTIGKRILVVLFFMFVFALLLLTFSISWGVRNYHNIGFDEILFHLNMPLQGADIYINDYLRAVLRPTIGIFVEIAVAAAIVFFFFTGSKKLKPVWEKGWTVRLICGIAVITVWLGINIRRADDHFNFVYCMKNLVRTSKLIENEYVDPHNVEISFPEKKRNLIYILLESGETSSQDKANGGQMEVNYTPEMSWIAKSNISFSQNDLLKGAGVAPDCTWTMGAMVGQSSGLPLKLFLNGGSVMEDYESFMPRILTLGDILEAQGYHNVFMAGSDFAFAGRKNYVTTHGHYEILDYNEAINRGVISADYKVWWGFEDEVLYRWAKEELIELAAKEEPFNFTMLTVDTHAQDGYVCERCRDEYEDQYANVWRCASEQVDEFVKWIQQQDFYENTTVVIVGDHLSMDTDFYVDDGSGWNDYKKDRGVYNAFLNVTDSVEGIGTDIEKNRKFTTLDFFPTMLAAIGIEIEGNQLGLGVNLFSGDETLAEKYGYDFLYAELAKRSVFYEREFLYAE